MPKQLKYPEGAAQGYLAPVATGQKQCSLSGDSYAIINAAYHYAASSLTTKISSRPETLASRLAAFLSAQRAFAISCLNSTQETRKKSTKEAFFLKVELRFMAFCHEIPMAKRTANLRRIAKSSNKKQRRFYGTTEYAETTEKKSVF